MTKKCDESKGRHNDCRSIVREVLCRIVRPYSIQEREVRDSQRRVESRIELYGRRKVKRKDEVTVRKDWEGRLSYAAWRAISRDDISRAGCRYPPPKVGTWWVEFTS